MKHERHLFAWPSRHNVHLALPLMLVLSFLLHAACVLIFQVTYPRANGGRERSAQVYFLRPGSAEAARIAPMLEASDPALFSPGQPFGRDVWKVPETAYVASFDWEKPGLTGLPSDSTARFSPSSSGSGRNAVTLTAPKASSPLQPGLPTMVKLGGALAGRTVTPPQNGKFSIIDVKSLKSTEFLLAVSPDGYPLHIFPQRSSGNEILDRAALRYLTGSRFSRDTASKEAVWGTATFVWGSDVQREREP